MLKIAYHPIYSHELPASHRFPMEKYDLLPEQLLYEGTCIAENFFTPEIPNNKHFFTVHDPEYFFDLFNISLSQKAARKNWLSVIGSPHRSRNDHCGWYDESK